MDIDKNRHADFGMAIFCIQYIFVSLPLEELTKLLL